MKNIKLLALLLLFMGSFKIYAQSQSNIVVMRWSTVDKSRVNSGRPYFYIIDENSNVERVNIKKERLEEGSTAILIHKKLKEYYAKGYKLLSSNFSATSMGYCDKGEYILIKDE